MNRYSTNGKLIAKNGKGQELLDILLEASEAMSDVDDCYCYIVGMNSDDPNAVYVFEVWEDESAHKASLELPAVKQLIQKAMPIIDGMDNSPDLTIYGGKATL